MTIYLFAMACESKFKVKEIYQFAKDYLPSWFPKLPSYVAFVNRLNRLSEAFKLLSATLMSECKPDNCIQEVSLLDSMPIITCSGKRTGKVAREITDKTYCSSKGLWYFGLKMHVLGWNRLNKLPFPESVVITQASENDLNVFKQNWAEIPNRHFFGDKIYAFGEFYDQFSKPNESIMFTPVKGVKNQTEFIKHFDRAASDLFSRAVSKVRQPIEAFFNWIEEKTRIQRASKVRSTKGLLVHVFGRLAVAFISLVF